jgi:hypothetical protein
VLEGIAAACGGWPVTADWLSGHEFDWQEAARLGVIRPVVFEPPRDGTRLLPPRYYLEQLRFARQLRAVTDRHKQRMIQFGAVQWLTSLRGRRTALFRAKVRGPTEEEENAYVVREIEQLRARLAPALTGEIALTEEVLDHLENEARRAEQATLDWEYEELSPEAKAALDAVQGEASPGP